MIARPLAGALVDWANPVTKDLRGYWIMEEGAGRGVRDISGRSAPGAFVGSPTWAGGASGGLSVRFPNVAANNITVPSHPLLDSALMAVTIAAWVNTNDSSASQGIFDHTSAGATNSSFQLQFNGGALQLRITNAASATTDLSLPVTAAINGKWIFACGTCDVAVGVSRVYANMASVSGVSPASIKTVSGVSIIGGLGSSVFPFSGSIDSVAVWGRALVPAEVQQLYLDPFCMILFEDYAQWFVAASGAGQPPRSMHQFRMRRAA